MDVVETKFFRDWDADARLAELLLTREGLVTAANVAIAESANATPFHPINAAGTFGYQHGTWALRNEFVGENWKLDRYEGVEAIRCDALVMRVAYSNVDIACNDDHLPQPRSSKGGGAERASFSSLFGESLPTFAPRPKGGWSLYYLMVDETGAAELTRPVIRNGSFVAAIERIYLSKGAGGDGVILSIDDEVGPEFEPLIVRK